MRFLVGLLMLMNAAVAIAADHTITFTCCQYSPPNLTINAGDRVFWNGAFGSHPLRQVTGPNSDTPFAGGFSNSAGSTFNVTFPTPGEIYYHCTLHGTAQFGGTMRGSITVLPVDAIFDDGFE